MQIHAQCLRDSPDPFLHESKEMIRLCTNFSADGHGMTCHQTEATSSVSTIFCSGTEKTMAKRRISLIGM